MPVCMAKTQYSLSDNANLLGRPEGFTVNIREGLCVRRRRILWWAITGAIMTMPGLPKVPSAEGIDVDESGRITGLFLK